MKALHFIFSGIWSVARNFKFHVVELMRFNVSHCTLHYLISCWNFICHLVCGDDGKTSYRSEFQLRYIFRKFYEEFDLVNRI